jgi:hypothetical protein
MPTYNFQWSRIGLSTEHLYEPVEITNFEKYDNIDAIAHARHLQLEYIKTHPSHGSSDRAFLFDASGKVVWARSP